MGRPKGAKNKLKNTQIVKTNKDIDKYDATIIRAYKELSLSIADTITEKDIKKASLSQRITAMAILQDKLNIKEGKSTENIAHKVVHSLDDESKALLESLGKSLIKSMLNSTD